jgi:hypothetical protein
VTKAEIKRRYTRIAKVGDKWHCDLSVGCQSFSICERDLKAEANWFAEMLAIAIQTVIKEASKGE